MPDFQRVRTRLLDILGAIEGIEKTTAGFNLDTYTMSWTTKRAVERGLEIISEASRHIPEPLKDQVPEVLWSRIAAIGNILRHEYHCVDDRAVWNFVRKQLSDLAAGTQKLINYLDEDAKKNL